MPKVLAETRRSCFYINKGLQVNVTKNVTKNDTINETPKGCNPMAFLTTTINEELLWLMKF